VGRVPTCHVKSQREFGDALSPTLSCALTASSNQMTRHLIQLTLIQPVPSMTRRFINFHEAPIRKSIVSINSSCGSQLCVGVYELEPIIYFQTRNTKENIKTIRLHGHRRGKRILAAEETRGL